MEAYQEASEPPQPLVAALGARELQSRVLQPIRLINEAFSPRLSFTELPTSHEFPLKKELREKPGTFTQMQRDFDGYSVEGILKAQWLNKHRHVLPSVVLLFHELDPRCSHLEWQRAENFLKEQVVNTRRMVAGRECRVLLLLLDKPETEGANVPTAVEERLAGLRRRFEMDSRSLVLLRPRDLTPQSTVILKLEATIRNASLEYYKAQSKRVKRYKKLVPKTTYLALHARYSFKIAHYYEFRRYTTKVIENYEAAYKEALSLGGLDGGSISDSFIMSSDGVISFSQLKTFAEYVHLKLCYYYMLHSNNVKAAVEQFYRHINAYSHAKGPVDRLYEHWAWVSRQYHVFAQLLVQATTARGSLPVLGIGSDVYKEPYMYFSTAAKYEMVRRKAAARLSVDTDMHDQYTFMSSVFLGGDGVMLDSSNTPSTSALTHYRHTLERQVPHTKQTIYLLEQAVVYLSSYVSTHKRPRNRLKSRLMMQMGAERLAAGQLDRAKVELQKAKLIASAEKWHAQSAQVLQQLLECTRLLGDVEAYVECGLQLLAPNLKPFVPVEDRRNVQASILLAWRDPAKVGDAFVSTESLSSLRIDVPPRQSVLTVHVDFAPPVAAVKEQVSILVRVESELVDVVYLDKMELCFNDDRYNVVVYHADTQELVYDDTRGVLTTSLALAPKQEKTLEIPLSIRPHCSVLQYTETRFFLSKDPGTEDTAEYLELSTPLAPDTSDKPLMNAQTPQMGQGPGSPSFASRKSMFSEEDVDRNKPHRSFLSIRPPVAKAQIQLLSTTDVLANDFRYLSFQIDSNGDVMSHVVLNVTCDPAPTSEAYEDAVLFTYEDGAYHPLALDPHSYQLSHGISLPDQEADASSRTHIVVRVPKACSMTLVASVSYENIGGIQVSTSVQTDLVARHPFSMYNLLLTDTPQRPTWTTNGGLSSASDAVVGVSSTLVGQIVCDAPETLDLLRMQFVASDSIDSLADIYPCGFDEHTHVLSTGDMHTFQLRLTPTRPSPSLTLGYVQLDWKRSGEDTPVTCLFHLPPLAFVQAPVSIRLDTPPYGTEGKMLQMRLHVKNNQAALQSIRMKLQDGTSDFFLQGRLQADEELLPEENRTFTLGLVPTHTGFLHLPTVEIHSLTHGGTISSTKDQPRVFILPAGSSSVTNASTSMVPS